MRCTHTYLIIMDVIESDSYPKRRIFVSNKQRARFKCSTYSYFSLKILEEYKIYLCNYMHICMYVVFLFDFLCLNLFAIYRLEIDKTSKAK